MTDFAGATFDRIAAASLAHAQANAPQATRSVADLPSFARVVVVANGPSLAGNLDALRLASMPVVCADGAMARLLMVGVVPDLVVTCDPHPRIAHWFGADDDDGHFARTGERALRGDLSGIPLAIATASHPRTVAQATAAGMALYWWHAMLDDPTRPGLTRGLYDLAPLPCINGGGNVGTAAWVLAHTILGAKDIALVGFDFGYPPGFPEERTQYAPERPSFVTYPNGWYADATFAWFRDVFMAMVKDAPCRTVNCSFGGTLEIERMALRVWIG